MEPVQELPPQRHVVDLVSDEEDRESLDLAEDIEDFGPFFDNAFHASDQIQLDGGDLNDFFAAPRLESSPHAAHNPIDLTGLDDSSDADNAPAHSSPSRTPLDTAMVMQDDHDLAVGELITVSACLQMVLNVLPDISVDHTLSVIFTSTKDATRTTAECERIIAQLLDGGGYPKENDEENSRKRKRNEDDSSGFEGGEEDAESPMYRRDALELLKDNFLDVKVRYIEDILQEQKTLFKAFGIVDKQLYDNHRAGNDTPSFKIRTARVERNVEAALIARGSTIPKELHAAKKKRDKDSVKRRKEEEDERAERANLEQARMTGQMTECLCCFDEFPINRMTSCNGSTVHLFCKPCAKKYVESEMGSSKCRPVCFADSSCGGPFTRAQLQDFLGDTTFDRLEHMQQQQDLAAAGLDFLSECPFCDFKAECPPVEVDKEFRCMNPKCRKTSCRLCDKETHVPLSCEEARKDDRLNVRHIVEEAMSAALIRYCNKCKQAFVKDYGCNKMTCTHCRNVQCYVCSKDVTDYRHFSDDRADGRNSHTCPLHDNVEDRHETEVKKAADEAMAKAKSDHPDMTEADLMIEVSDRVKRLEEARRGQAQAQHAAFPWHMRGGVLVNEPAPAPNPQPPRYDVHWNAENVFPADFNEQFRDFNDPFHIPFPAPPPQQPGVGFPQPGLEFLGPVFNMLGGAVQQIGVQQPPAPFQGLHFLNLGPNAAPPVPPAMQAPRAAPAPPAPPAPPIRRVPSVPRGRPVRGRGRRY